MTKDIASGHPEGVEGWFIGSLDSNKCDFIRVLSNILKKENGTFSNLNDKNNW